MKLEEAMATGLPIKRAAGSGYSLFKKDSPINVESALADDWEVDTRKSLTFGDFAKIEELLEEYDLAGLKNIKDLIDNKICRRETP